VNRSQGNLQDAFLNSARRESVGVTIYLVSGVQLRGIIKAFDAFTVLLESPGRPAQMVYKHAIASVAPMRAVEMDGSAREEARSAANGATADSDEPPATVERELSVSP
jgi:host factor-I protein